MNGKYNIAIGFIIMGAFMLYGFLLIYLRDLHPMPKNGQMLMVTVSILKHDWHTYTAIYLLF